MNCFDGNILWCMWERDIFYGYVKERKRYILMVYVSKELFDSNWYDKDMRLIWQRY